MPLSNTIRLSSICVLITTIVGCAPHSQTNYEDNIEQSLNTLKSWSHEKQVDAEKVTTITELMSIPELNQLVEHAMQNNPSLQQTGLALQIAYAQKRETGAEQLPSAELNFGASKGEDEDDSFTSELSVSWEIDIWQKVADSKAAASASILSAAADYQAAKDTLAADIMRQWLKISMYQQFVAIEKDRLKSLKNNELFVLERYRKGLGELEDLDSALTSSESAQATIADYEQSLDSARLSLKILLGELGEAVLPTVPSTFPQVILPLTDLPSQDLSRRPDLRSAFADIQAQQYTTQVAYKDMLPSLSLTAALNDSSTNLSDSLLVSPLWSLLGQISAPLFQGGKLKAAAEIEELNTEKTFWVYQETLLTAVNEVEEALSQEHALYLQQHHLNLSLASVLRSESNYQDKYRKGLVDVLDFLSVQQQTYDTKIQLVQTTHDRLSNRIDLGLALGLGVINESK